MDSFGYLEEAIAEAERAAGIAKGTASVTRFMQPVSLFGSPFGASSPLLGVAGRDLRDVASELSQPRLMYQLNWQAATCGQQSGAATAPGRPR